MTPTPPPLAGLWSDVTAVILAGGTGTRLRPVVDDRPKGLAEVEGRPFLSFLLGQLDAAGVRRVVFSTGYLAPRIEAEFGDRFGGMGLSYSPEETALGTGGGLRLAATRIDSSSLLVLNGDSFCDVDLGAFLADHLGAGRLPSMVLSRQADTTRFGRVDLTPDGRIGSFAEKGAATGAGWINAGIYAVDRRQVLTVAAGRAVSLEREVFPAWIEGGLRGFPCEGRFLDIGTPESYRQAAAFFREVQPPPPN